MARPTGISTVRKLIVNKAAAAAALCLVAAAAAAGRPLLFDDVFNDRGEPARLHFRASYNVGGQAHSLQAWREGSERLRRSADNAVENFVFQAPGDTEWRMTVLDLRRKIRSDVDRNSLQRLGQFTDWFSLSHGLARPVGAYSLAALQKGPVLPVKPITSCRWYRLEQAGRESSICWSSALRLPLLIVDAAGGVQWRVTQADTSVPQGTFLINDVGFVKNDAGADIKGD